MANEHKQVIVWRCVINTGAYWIMRPNYQAYRMSCLLQTAHRINIDWSKMFDYKNDDSPPSSNNSQSNVDFFFVRQRWSRQQLNATTTNLDKRETHGWICFVFCLLILWFERDTTGGAIFTSFENQSGVLIQLDSITVKELTWQRMADYRNQDTP